MRCRFDFLMFYLQELKLGFTNFTEKINVCCIVNFLNSFIILCYQSPLPIESLGETRKSICMLFSFFKFAYNFKQYLIFCLLYLFLFLRMKKLKNLFIEHNLIERKLEHIHLSHSSGEIETSSSGKYL